MSLCLGDIAKATFDAKPEKSFSDGTSRRVFECKEYPRLVIIRNSAPGFVRESTFMVDGEECADMPEVLARLNKIPPRPLGAPINMSARTKWVTA